MTAWEIALAAASGRGRGLRTYGGTTTVTIQAEHYGRARIPPYVKVDVFADGDACLTVRDHDDDLTTIALSPEPFRSTNHRRDI